MILLQHNHLNAGGVLHVWATRASVIVIKEKCG